jgi:hypothetical protein
MIMKHTFDYAASCRGHRVPVSAPSPRPPPATGVTGAGSCAVRSAEQFFGISWFARGWGERQSRSRGTWCATGLWTKRLETVDGHGFGARAF